MCRDHEADGASPRAFVCDDITWANARDRWPGVAITMAFFLLDRQNTSGLPDGSVCTDDPDGISLVQLLFDLGQLSVSLRPGKRASAGRDEERDVDRWPVRPSF